MENLTWAIIGFFGSLGIKYNWDRNQRLDNKKINHKLEGWIFGIALALCAVFGFGHNMLSPSMDKTIWYYLLWALYSIIAGIMEYFWFWFLFDGLYGKYIAKVNWWFTGSEDGADDAKTDNFLQTLKPKVVLGYTFSPLFQHKLIKIGGIIISTIIYFLVYLKK